MKGTVGFVGVGLMGHGMCHNLLKAGHDLFVIAHRQRERIDDLVRHGAHESKSLAELVNEVDTIVLCLPSTLAMTSTLTGENGILAAQSNGLLVIDCTTNDPVLTVQMGDECRRAGVALVDAPVMRGIKSAREGRLIALIGGETKDIERAIEVIDSFTERFFLMGELGSGQQAKVLNNGIGMMQFAAMCEAFVVARQTGIDMQTFLEAYILGNAASPLLADLLRRLVQDDHSVSFTTAIGAKDLSLFLETGGRFNANQTVGNAAMEHFQAAIGEGLGDDNGSRIATVLGGGTE